MPTVIHVIAGSGGGTRKDGRARSPIEVVFVSTKVGGGDEPPKDEREGESKHADPSMVDSSPSDDGRSAVMEESSSKKMPSNAPAPGVTDKIFSSNAKLTQQQFVRGTMKENASPQKEVSADSSVRGNSKVGDSRNKKHRKRKKKFIDVSDVAAQPPIISNRKNATSKYQGVSFHKAKNKWAAQIKIDGKDRYIGLYDSEEEAAVDYARAVFKYGTEESNGRRLQKKKHIDLTNVPEQLPIIRSNWNGATSKYLGVCFDTATKKWRAMITIDGKQHHIGYYDDEEAAAVDYARAVFKYRAGDAEVRCEQVQKVAVSETGGKSHDSPSYALTNDAKDTNQGANMGQEMKEDAVKTALGNHTASVPRALFLQGASMVEKRLDEAEVAAVRKETMIALRDANFQPPVYSYSAIREAPAEAENQVYRLAVNDSDPDWPLTNIDEPGPNDCLFGRGGGTNHHAGNKKYRKKVEEKKDKYLSSKRLDKAHVAMEIINEWRSMDPPGRFLKQDKKTKLWHDVGDRQAREKTCQALREKAPSEDGSSTRGEQKETRFEPCTLSPRGGRSKPSLAREHRLGTDPMGAQMRIDGKDHHIGLYDDEKAAAVDHALAVFKYRAGDAEVRREQEQKVAVSETGGKSHDSPSYALMNDAKDTNQVANANVGQEMKEDAVKTALSNHTASVPRALFLRGASMGQKSLDEAEVAAVRKVTMSALRDANFQPPVYSAIREALSEPENQAYRLTVNDMKSGQDLLLFAREVPKRPHSDNENEIEQSKKRAKMCRHEHEDEDSEERMTGTESLPTCCIYGCMNGATKGGVCWRHGET